MRVSPHYSSQEVLQFTFDSAKKLANIKGVFVECGVASGSQIGIMRECDTSRLIYGFDSFEGIPYAGAEDFDQPGIGAKDPTKEGLLESTGVASHDEQTVLRNFAKWGLPTDNLILIKGWFENTMPLADTGPIALLRLDGDLYRSTKVCLEHLLPLVVSGGRVIIDDYSLPGCRKAVNEFIPHKKVKQTLGIAYYDIP